MNLQKAERRKVKIKCMLAGPSGSGKTFSALLLAFGLCGDWSKIAVIDTENESSNLYAHLGTFNVINILAPFTPEKYSEAISICESNGVEVIIVDSLTHQWLYLLEYHSGLSGNSFTNWGKVTPRYDAFTQKMLQSTCHVVATSRTKQDYVLSEKNGKMVPEKVGLKAVQRDGLDYEFTLVFDIDMKNHANASKDRTGLFFNQPTQKISINTGIIIKDWCNTGSELNSEYITTRIQECKSIKELLELYETFPQYKETLKPEYERQKRQVMINLEVKQLLSTQNPLSNGTT